MAATLSSQISSLSSAQKTQLSVKLQPMLGPLVALMPAAAPLVQVFTSAGPSALATAIRPIEPLLPAQAKSMIQSAITSVVGAKAAAPKTSTRTPVPINKGPVVRAVPGVVTPDAVAAPSGGFLSSTPVKVGIVVALVAAGFALTRKKPRKNPSRRRRVRRTRRR